MEVVHQGDSITHAVIGGKAAIEMKTDDSAHLMHMLSKALYKDQILAVCREVICNAWDAHIEAGITDRPIEINFMDDILSITDYGPGIPYDKMGPIYGTYGGSTKKDSNDQTGGFGLGCKSPFAYTEHFDVISTHGGERTIYKITKSSAEIAGKPGIIPISSFPSDESGLTVRIRIAPEDIREFKAKIERVVRNGEIKANFNGTRMTDLIEFSKATAPWILTTHDPYPGERDKVFVRYGNVIYPIDDHPEYSSLYKDAMNQVAEFTGSNSRYDRMNIILMAEPSSLSIAPSRETLSMQEHTIASITKMLQSFVSNARKVLAPRLKVIAQNNVKKLVEKKNTRKLLTRRSIPMVDYSDMGVAASFRGMRPELPEFIYDLADLAETYMRSYYPEEPNFWMDDLRFRIKKLMEAKLINRQLGTSYLKQLKITRLTGGSVRSSNNSWMINKIVAPMKFKLRTKGLNANTLYAYDCDSGEWQYGDAYLRKPKFHNTSTLLNSSLRYQIPYLRNIVVLAYGKKSTEQRLEGIMKEMGYTHDGEFNYNGVMVYIVNKKKESVERAREALKGYTLIDLTVRHEKENANVIIEPKERKPRLKGYASLAGMFVTQTVQRPDGQGVEKKTLNSIDFRRFLDEDINREYRIEKPEFIFQQSMATGRYGTAQDRLLSLSTKDTLAFMKLFQHIGAVTNSHPQVVRAAKHDGVLSLQDWLAKKLRDMLSDPAWRIRYSNSFDCADRHLYKDRPYRGAPAADSTLIKLVLGVKGIREAFGINDVLSHEEKVILRAFHNICEFTDDCKEIIGKLNLIYPSADALRLEHKLKGNRLVTLIDERRIHDIITSTKESDAVKKSCIDFVIRAIEA